MTKFHPSHRCQRHTPGTLQEALDVYRELGDRGSEAEALNEVGALHKPGGDLSRARSCHQQGLDLARQIGSSWDEARASAKES